MSFNKSLGLFENKLIRHAMLCPSPADIFAKVPKTIHRPGSPLFRNFQNGVIKSNTTYIWLIACSEDQTSPLPPDSPPPFSNKKLQKIESFYLGNTLGNYKSNLNKINEVTIISILRFTWNSSLLSFFNSTRIILRHVAKSHFFTFFKGL